MKDCVSSKALQIKIQADFAFSVDAQKDSSFHFSTLFPLKQQIKARGGLCKGWGRHQWSITAVLSSMGTLPQLRQLQQSKEERTQAAGQHNGKPKLYFFFMENNKKSKAALWEGDLHLHPHSRCQALPSWRAGCPRKSPWSRLPVCSPGRDTYLLLVSRIISIYWVNERQTTVHPEKHLLFKYFRAINLSQRSLSSAR